MALLAGLTLRAIFIANHARFSGDALVYADLAHNMLAHHVFGFTEDVIRPTLIRLPGYPLFLALCFAIFGNANYLAVLWIQVVIDLGSCVLLSILARRFMGRRAGTIALWLAALCPFTANYTAVVLTETCTLFGVVLAFFALERWSARWSASGGRGFTGSAWAWALLTGFALAFSVLLRPDQGLLAAAIFPAMLWIGSERGNASKPGGASLFLRLLPAVSAALMLALPLTLWGLRNWSVFHVFQPLAPRYANDPGESVPFGFQRWYRTWAVDFKATVDIYWNYDGNPLNLGNLPSRAFDNRQQLAQTRALFAQYNDEDASTPAFDLAFARLAAERVADYPLRYYVLMPMARELDMWLRPRTELMKLPLDWWAVRAHPKRSIAEMAYAALDIAYLAAAVMGFLRWRRAGWNGRHAPGRYHNACGRDERMRASIFSERTNQIEMGSRAATRRDAALAYAMLAFVILRCLLLLTLDNSEPRYTLECFPIVILLASFALATQWPAAALSDSP